MLESKLINFEGLRIKWMTGKVLFVVTQKRWSQVLSHDSTCKNYSQYHMVYELFAQGMSTTAALIM
jgi:hypothetical protein